MFFLFFPQKYDVLGFAANGRISGPPVFRVLTSSKPFLDLVTSTKTKDLDETHLLVNVQQI